MSSRFIFIYNRPNVFSQTGSHQFCGDGWQGRWLPDAGTGRLSKVIIYPQRQNLSSILMLILADGRDLPPPPPQFDDPPPAAGLDQFGRGSKFKKQKTDLVNFSFAIFSRRVHDLDNLGHGQLPRLPTGQLPDQIPSGSSLLHLLPVLLHGHPHHHTGCNLFLFLLKEFLFSRQLPQDRIQTRFFSLLVTTT